jgi:D-alanyl-D-alanine carboxypeptidase/D-alanyl-D-alanine-endopeptidase (penicillin-binding protein 4)
VVSPGAEVGSRARVALETPVKGYLEIDDQVATGGPGTRKWIEVERDVTDASTKFTLTGSVPVDDAERTWIRRTVGDPTQHFVAAFREQLEEQGVAVTGKFREGTVPERTDVLLAVESPPLSAVLMDMNKLSLNFYAEQVLRTLGAETEGDGSTEGGLRAVRAYLDGLGVPEGDAVLVNGSGLSREARVKASVLTAVLVDMGHDTRVGAEFASSLAIAGTDGTLWSRLREDPGRLRAKTGTIDDVHCLAGYVDAASGRRYAFAFLVNGTGPRIQAVRDVHDTFARSMFEVGREGAE